jgi:hypothetical protein
MISCRRAFTKWSRRASIRAAASPIKCAPPKAVSGVLQRVVVRRLQGVGSRAGVPESWRGGAAAAWQWNDATVFRVRTAPQRVRVVVVAVAGHQRGVARRCGHGATRSATARRGRAQRRRGRRSCGASAAFKVLPSRNSASLSWKKRLARFAKNAVSKEHGTRVRQRVEFAEGALSDARRGHAFETQQRRASTRQ